MPHVRIARAATLLLLAAVMLTAGCSSRSIDFPYANERYVYPESTSDLVRVHLGVVHDLRTDDQRKGSGRFIGITYPSDSDWARPVPDIYRDALARDIAQTRLMELTPLASQAAYTLEAEIESFHCRVERPPLAFALPIAAGALAGFALGDDAQGRLKRGAVFGMAGLMAMPMPARHRAEVIVRLVLRDRAGAIVWERTCLGEVEDTAGEPVTSRRHGMNAERYLPQAVKRANACLLGQLRQFLISG